MLTQMASLVNVNVFDECSVEIDWAMNLTV